MKNIRFIYIVTLIFSIFLISDVYALSVGRVVSNSEINIREKASVTGKITGGLKYNDEIILYNNKTLNPNKSCTMGWYKIKYKDNIGYVCSNYISKSINTATIISKKKISIKSKPNISSKTYKRINNKTVTLLSTKKYKGKGCSNGWYKINYDGYTKYVCSSYVTSRNNSSTVITTNRNKTKLYNKFSTSKRNFISVKYGTPLTLISKKLYKGKNCSSGYYKISYSKQIRYVCSKNVLITNKVCSCQ